ncbi:serine hydrolase [Loigolactobacillus binensis]|uniref:Serine hydrolase n=1 Tax=Loigolactobacillus binensis TaxID=2559922 RepID=A0ABW3EFZ4_9LACO|nr:serine hydrolase [Loigolactobacillus binensis]
MHNYRLKRKYRRRLRRIELIIVLLGVITVGLLSWHLVSENNHAEQQTHAQAASVSTPTVSKATVAANKKRSIIAQNLQTYLDKVTADGDASVSFYSLAATSGSTAATTTDQLVYGNGKINVNSNATTTETSASTYKLFIAAYLFHLHKAGKFSWTAANKSGFYQMVVNSSNDYPQRILTTYGRSRINAFIKRQGWASPVFYGDGTASSTTSKSLRELLQALAAGTGAFSNASDRQYLLSLMKAQIYRDGIPTGVASVDSGATVADKVGFLDDINNDAGIVTTSAGQRYILVIMTHGHNQTMLDFSRIAAIAAKVQTIVYGANAGTQLINYSAD